MKTIRGFLAILMVLIAGGVIAPSAWAASCSEVYSSSDGINDNLQASGNTLDLSGVPFANNPWPASGTTLSPGDYYYASANLDNGYRLNVANGAQVRIFVNGSLNTGNNVDFNPGGDNDQFLLVVNGSLSTGNNADIRGLVYASGAIGLGNNVDLRGGLAAGGGISTGNQPPVADYSGVGAGLLDGLCDTPLELLANGQSESPVTIDVGSTVNFTVEADACPTAQAVFWDDEWIDTWSVTGGPSQSGGFSASPCDRLVEWSQTFDQEGIYTVSYQSEYCSARGFFFGLPYCTQYSEFGADDIVIEVLSPTDSLNCDTQDDFSGGSLNPDLWVTSSSNGDFTPGIVGGRLRMTEAVSNQATAATLQAEIPGADNLVILQFDYYAYDGSGADGVAVVLSDSAFTAQPGSYGGSLGYAQRLGNDEGPGFAGGWLGVGIDEYGNFSNESEGREGGSGFTPQSVAIRGSGSGFDGYRYLRGTGGLTPGIDATGRFNTHTYEITVDSRNDGEAIVSVRRDTGNGMQQLIAPFNVLAEQGQAAVPENFLLSLTGSTGGSTNIHELDNVELCALRINPVGEQVDHFEIRHDGVALTCQPETVTIRACANGSCDELFTGPVQATLEPLDGWQGGNVVSFSGGTGQATLANTVAGVVDLDVIGSQPSTRPQAVTLCQIGAGNLSAENCELEFFDSGLAFEVPNLTSHRPSGPVEVRAVRRDPDSQACVPAFENVEKPVRFWSTYVDPGPNGRPVSRALSVDDNDVSGDSNNPTVLDLDFGAGGIAEIDVRYFDAGQVQLSGTYIGSAATDDEGLVMRGSDQFVSVPAGLCLRTGGECSAGDASCPRFVKAEEDFNLLITAVGWQSDGDSNLCEGNPVTPNFRLLDIPLSSEVVAPSGGDNGTVSPLSYSHTRSADATETVSANVSEVGVFRFKADPETGTYLGLTAPVGSSEPTGRFYPDRFEVTVDPGELEAACTVATPFTYIGQDMEWELAPSLEIEPVSVEGNRTVNYTEPGFQRLSTAGITRTSPADDSSVLNLDGDPLAVTAVSGGGTLMVGVPGPGMLRFDYASDDTVSYNKVPEARVPPFGPALEYIVTDIVDSDGVSGAEDSYPFTPLADFKVRYGRLSMENVYGPENINELPMPFRLEYWNGSRFVVNTADSCTGWAADDIGGTTAHHTLAPDSGDFSAGEAGPLRLEPAGSQGTDTLLWDVPDWLTDDFNGDGSLEDPSALATFGVYRGHDRVIYWQEK